MKVTFCAYDKPDNVGGPISWIRRLFPLLRERGIEPRCLFFMHWGNSGPALTPLIETGFECRQFSLAHTEDRIRWILDDIRDNPPDVFVPNLVVAGFHAARWVRDAGIPTVGVLHSADRFYRALTSEFVTGSAENQLDAIVCVSRQIEEEVSSHPPTRTMVRRIPYGVNIPSATVTREANSLRLAYVGRLVEEQKRISDLTRALIRATREVPGTTALIYGDGRDRGNVTKLLASHPEADVQLAGLVDSEAIQQRLLDVDVIVLLSDYEGLPIALLEAMACGCVPVCLRGRSGIGELVEHEVTGLVVDDRDSGFVDAIRRLAENATLWSRLSLAARRKAEEFSAGRSAEEWAALFRKISSAAPMQKRTVPAAPKKLRLPAVNPDLASADRRFVGSPRLSRLASRGLAVLGSWKRAIMR